MTVADSLTPADMQGAVHTVIAQNRLMAVHRDVAAGKVEKHSLIPENGEGMK